MYATAAHGHFDICKWLFEYGGDAKFQINKETHFGDTPLRKSYEGWCYGGDNEGKTCRWLLQNGGGQHLSPKAMGRLRLNGNEEINANLLVLWMRENMQLYDTFILLLCGATTMITSSSKTNDGRSLQILDGHPGIMELIGNYVGLLRGK